uniref:DUF632 domain-containing protein n=1 Tax=Lactuca sativa TaxID=4236 RepID=A0A9R1W184_LACSA|nr:hypothetical protein LSAT_V11C300118630 [Lactuca sativa]
MTDVFDGMRKQEQLCVFMKFEETEEAHQVSLRDPIRKGADDNDLRQIIGVAASESIKKEYDRKCDQLRHQLAKDLKPHVIDKTQATAKDLHSRIWVALHTVDSISKRIEKIRDEELQPQELIQGCIPLQSDDFRQAARHSIHQTPSKLLSLILLLSVKKDIKAI